MRYGSVCSGIEAASVAWHPLGWSAAWLAEIERFPSRVLAHHYPAVPNLGDMRTISRRVLTGEVEAPDVLVGGTPCQAFSIAGLREGLSDERGQLTISYVRLFDAIDYIRSRAGKRPAIACWENVPGVLSSKDNAFGCILAGLAGEDVELIPPGKKWANAGCVYGPKRTVAWRVLDAQYFGVAQRRRRVFVIASARKDCDPAKILFEFDGVRRDSAPSREAGQETAGTLASRTGAGGFPGTDEACSGYLQAFGGGNTGGAIDFATCLTTSGQQMDFDTETFAIQAGALRTNPSSGPDGIGVQEAIAYTLEARAEVQAVCVTGDITHTLKAEGFDASEDGTGRGNPIVPAYSVALRGREGGATAELGDEVAGCLRASTGGGDKPHVLFKNGELNGSTYEADASSILRTLRATIGEEKVAEWFIGILDSLQSPEVLRSWLHGESIRSSSGDFRSFVGNFPLPRQEGLPARTLREVWENGPDGCTPQGRGLAKQLAFEFGEGLPELSSSGAFGTEVLHRLRSKAEGARVLRKTLSTLQEMGRPSYDESQSAQPTMQVRRLTPKECARLQAFPDDYLSSVRVDGKPPADGPMYKSLGNSMCVNVMAFIGRRIQQEAA